MRLFFQLQRHQSVVLVPVPDPNTPSHQLGSHMGVTRDQAGCLLRDATSSGHFLNVETQTLDETLLVSAIMESSHAGYQAGLVEGDLLRLRRLCPSLISSLRPPRYSLSGK